MPREQAFYGDGKFRPDEMLCRQIRWYTLDTEHAVILAVCPWKKRCLLVFMFMATSVLEATKTASSPAGAHKRTFKSSPVNPLIRPRTMHDGP
jgi:hypothetical protein